MDQENEHTKKLAAARGKLVDERRTVADALGKPYKKGHTENMRAAFVLVQNSIEAVDRALARRTEHGWIKARHSGSGNS